MWGEGFEISDRHRPGAKLLLAPHEGDLSLAEASTMRYSRAGFREASSTGSAARHGEMDPANRPANSAGINDHRMRRTRPTSLNALIAARKDSSGLGAELFRSY